ncbi:MAG: 3-isopropylmalate dehydratase small subunit [Propionibacteriaceae bacterium]|jgi:3-isopropylmalate/(R)-2-methylmalate dehydratase small subunit|nr:3-isopropylmalate dehydratase small subunit [Propionibacteriaceae bacterium]
MEKFTTHTGVAVPLRRSNVDTDQIIPAVYLKRVTRTGFEDGLFSAWRNDPTFVLNQKPYESGSILVAGPDFGTGSSREHAVWALMDYGFRVVISPRFGDIFRSNAGKAGLVTAVLPERAVEELWSALDSQVGITLSVDLATTSITAGDRVYQFSIEEYTRYRLLNGLDDISVTLQAEAEIRAYEARRPAFKPTTLPVRV